MFTIEVENENHADAIRAVTISAFEASEFGHNGEAGIVDTIRANHKGALSLVALEEGVVIGHVVFSPAVIQGVKGQMRGYGLGPMSVHPDHQRKGIGSSLIENGLDMLKQDEGKFVVVAGHPSYYPRFGFAPAMQLGIKHAFQGMPQEILFLASDDPKAIAKVSPGIVYYCAEFGSQKG